VIEDLNVFWSRSINERYSNGALIYAGSKFQKFNLWIPNRDSTVAQTILRLVKTRYAQFGRSYSALRWAIGIRPTDGLRLRQ
jgi:hypothetical protein